MFDNLSKKEKIIFLVFFIVAMASWTLILIDLDRNFSTKIPAYGGSIVEGVVGTPRFINPLLAISDADRDLTRIVYAGLMRPDENGELVEQLAERYEISNDGLEYTFVLREDLYWHDGERLTTQDIAYTIELARNSAIRSAKLANWEGVEINVINDREITFVLNRPYAPFLGNTTLGIMPKHRWKDITPEAFPLAELNTKPVGSGPFKVNEITRNSSGIITEYSLRRYKRYQPQSAYLNKLYFKFYQTEEELVNAVENGVVDTAGVELVKIPKNSLVHEIRLPRVVGVFFNQDSAPLFKDATLREALSLATDRARIIREVETGHAIPTSLPIPPGTFAHASTLEDLVFDVDAARTILEEAGYEQSEEDDILEQVDKNERTRASFKLATLQTEDLARTAELLKEMWRDIGVEVIVEQYEKGDFEQSIIRPRDYDALLFGQITGYDVDPFGFWHARQIKHPGSNIALYANTKVDGYLEDAQESTSREKREELYKFFQQEIVKDHPAVFLYSPTYLYVVPDNLKGAYSAFVPFPQERFSSISTWYTKTKSVWNILVEL
jgi:peptide/nickel transport system substrate-binding protein